MRSSCTWVQPPAGSSERARPAREGLLRCVGCRPAPLSSFAAKADGSQRASLSQDFLGSWKTITALRPASLRCRFRKPNPFDGAVADESEHDHRIIAIGLLFVRMLCGLLQVAKMTGSRLVKPLMRSSDCRFAPQAGRYLSPRHNLRPRNARDCERGSARGQIQKISAGKFISILPISGLASRSPGRRGQRGVGDRSIVLAVFKIYHQLEFALLLQRKIGWSVPTRNGAVISRDGTLPWRCSPTTVKYVTSSPSNERMRVWVPPVK